MISCLEHDKTEKYAKAKNSGKKLKLKKHKKNALAEKILNLKNPNFFKN